MDNRIGIIVATHGDLARSLLGTAELILGRPCGMTPFVLSADEPAQSAYQRLHALVQRAEAGRGVILLVDLFGGTPGSLALSMLSDAGVGVVTGVNLPMILAAAGLTAEQSLEQATTALENAGRNAIKSAGQLLKSG